MGHNVPNLSLIFMLCVVENAPLNKVGNKSETMLPHFLICLYIFSSLCFPTFFLFLLLPSFSSFLFLKVLHTYFFGGLTNYFQIVTELFLLR
jgi:hypothetical protein